MNIIIYLGMKMAKVLTFLLLVGFLLFSVVIAQPNSPTKVLPAPSPSPTANGTGISQTGSPKLSSTGSSIFSTGTKTTASTTLSSNNTQGLPWLSVTAMVTATPTTTPVITCSAGIDPVWKIFWPKTARFSYVQRPCPPQFVGHAKRFCKHNGQWAPPNLFNCRSENFDGLSSQANTFFNDQPDVSGALYLIGQLKNITRPGMRRLPPGDLYSLNYIVKRSLLILKRQGGRGSDQGTDVLDTLNNALDPENKESWLELQDSDSAGSEELLSNAESYGVYLASTINSTSEAAQYSRTNLALRAKRFSNSDGRFYNSRFPSESDLVNSSNSDITNTIIIPAAYLEARANDSNADGEVSVVSMLFPSLQDFLPSANNDTIVSVILSSQVITDDNQTTSGNTTIESVLMESPIELTFALDLSNVTYNVSSEKLSFSCVSWLYSADFNATSEGRWVPDGIMTSTDNTSNDTVVHCYSSHLTSFAVLVSVVDLETTSVNDTVPIDIEAQLLSLVSYIGCSISIVCLIIAITCLLTLKKELIQKPLNLLHLNLSIALLLALVFFVGGIETAVSIPELCTTITVLMHYFFMAAFSWMFCEALMLYFLVVIVFSRLSDKWWLYLLIGWGLPLIPVVITLAVRFHDYRAKDLCWLNTKHGIIWSFVGPIILVICINTVILVIVLIRIGQSFYTKKRRQTISKRNGNNKKPKGQNNAMNIVKAMILLVPLLGSTWIIGIFAVNDNTTVFTWLFVILNSLQGAFIFFFHVFKGPLVWGRFKKWHSRNKRKKESSIALKKGLSTCDNTALQEIEGSQL